MKVRSTFITAFAVLALAATTPVLAHDTGDKVTPVFEQAIPNIPGKTLTALAVDYEPAKLPCRMCIRGPASSTPMS